MSTSTVHSLVNREWDEIKIRQGLNEVTKEQLAKLKGFAGFNKGVAAGTFKIMATKKAKADDADETNEKEPSKNSEPPKVKEPEPKPDPKKGAKADAKDDVAPPPWDK